MNRYITIISLTRRTPTTSSISELQIVLQLMLIQIEAHYIGGSSMSSVGGLILQQKRRRKMKKGFHLV
jgi:hypothetical protein